MYRVKKRKKLLMIIRSVHDVTSTFFQSFWIPASKSFSILLFFDFVYLGCCGRQRWDYVLFMFRLEFNFNKCPGNMWSMCFAVAIFCRKLFIHISFEMIAKSFCELLFSFTSFALRFLVTVKDQKKSLHTYLLIGKIIFKLHFILLYLIF